MTTILLVSGIQLIFLGVLGEYAGRTYLNLNNQPQSSIREVLNHEKPIPSISTPPPVRLKEATSSANRIYKEVVR